MTDSVNYHTIERDIRAAFENGLPQRIKRHIEIKTHPIIPNHHFASVSTECQNLFRDGHFYGCISLAQAGSEAIVKFLCERNNWSPEKEYEKNVNTLAKRGFILDDLCAKFLKIWENRNDYHHLNTTIEKDYLKLENVAKEKIFLLAEIEASIFACTINNGSLCPQNPQYWDIEQGRVPVYLRCDLLLKSNNTLPHDRLLPPILIHPRSPKSQNWLTWGNNF